MNARRSCRGFPTPTCLVLVSRPCRKERAQAWDSVAKAAKEPVPAPGQDQIAARYRQFATLCLRSRRYLTLPISSQQAPSPSATSSRPQSRAGSRRVGVAKNLRAPRHATVGDVLGEAMELHGTSDDGRRDGIYNQREHGRRGSLSRAAPRITYRDEPGVYLALVTETPAARANKVSHLWLHEVLDGSDLYIMDPWNRGESKTPIRKVAEPLSSVEELLPAEAGQALAGEALRLALDAIRSDPGARLQPGTLRVWRRARADPPSSATATGTSASAATLNRAAATSSASSAAATSSAAASSSTTDAASSGAAGSAQAGSSTVSSEAGLGISWTELEPTLYGRATQRRSSCPVPTDRYDEHLNDIIVHNMQDLSPWADSQDVQARAPISGMTIRAGSLFNASNREPPPGGWRSCSRARHRRGASW